MHIFPEKVDGQTRLILENVCALLKQKKEFRYNFAAYLFGSVLAGGSSWADIDILIVIQVASDLDHIRYVLEPLAATVPLHVTVVLQSEFDELGADAWGKLHKLVFC